MNRQRLLGTVLLAVGVILLVVGMNASHSMADQWSNFFTGKFTDKTVWYIVGGVASVLVGLSLFMFGRRTTLL